MFKRILELKQAAAANDYQHQENNIINEIKSDLSRDSSHRAKQNAAIKYSDWFYNQHGHDYSLNNQKTCAQKTIDIVGIDVNTAVEIQYRVIRAYEIAEGILNARETIQQHHLTASSLINQQLTSQVQNLSINSPQVPQAPDNYSSASQIPARRGVTIDDCIVDIGEGKKAINCSGIQSKHSKDTSLEGKLQISQAICNVLSLRETKVKNPYIANNIKVIDLSNCNINSEDVRFFSSRVAHLDLDLDLDALNIGNNPLGNIGAEKLLCYSVLNYSVTHTLRHIDLSNCTLGDNGAIHFSTASKNWNRIESANLSNNAIGDPGARAIANAFYHGQFPHLKGLDFHGNKISPEGYGYLAKILETVPRQMQTKDIAITLEVHKEQRSALEFIKHAAKYIFDQHYKTVSNNHEAELLVYGDGDWSHCKKVMVDLSRSMSVGLIRQVTDKDTVQKIKAIKSKKDIAVIAGGIFTAVAKDSGDAVFNADGAHCMAAINNFFGFHTITDSNPPHLGEFYDMDSAFYDIP